MVKYPNYLAGSQDDINKRLLHMILELKKSEGADITAIESDITDLKSAVGASDTAAGSLKKRCKDIETAIGDEDTAASILGRIKALEDG